MHVLFVPCTQRSICLTLFALKIYPKINFYILQKSFFVFQEKEIFSVVSVVFFFVMERIQITVVLTPYGKNDLRRLWCSVLWLTGIVCVCVCISCSHN